MFLVVSANLGGLLQNVLVKCTFILMTTRAASDADLETFRDFLIRYNKVTEQCFGSCVNDFTVRSVTKKEEKCSLNCLNKFLKMTQRLSLRLQTSKNAKPPKRQLLQ
ncbi:hypothetical protein KIN20_027019 [Parelaphostrongylus tenuis]|uniref:Mitochondrial import inner membrane translocase subunit n=1 Tax=Parelaphostrongylus tenuis TaxID=148309 RepID=A0AAD5QZ09_PARTN|nr:hypothetical protein KIN20_027019 [Parelaphostrongylus tenuis]